ncbi:Signal recognition particle GTPase [Burkholderia pseudomallei]|uniref:plasmid replication protein, CyRepA1 family n=1 Tax=Burkholderia pseudomallei TaxID=28450 RepID=UPI000F11E4DD|nr:plasmid replication protein, CyRepA1 family [Burkholderia pseudomallei]VBM56235.1 Signal recognition particle GTPase [Burkholderia pseudomallei]
MQAKQKVAINRHIINKIDKQDKAQLRTLTHEFENLELTPDELAAFINDGHPFCAQHNGARKGENFICSDVLAVDIDSGLLLDDALQDEYVRQFASIVYPTPSHTREQHRFRIVFQLDRTINDPNDMRAAYQGIIRLFGGDGSCKDACRLFFGSTGCNPIILGNFLPGAELDKLLIMGREVRVSDSDGDPEVRTKRAPVGNRSQISLEKDQRVRLAEGSSAALESLNARTPIHCPVHLDRNASAMVVVNKHGKRGVFCSACASTFWHDEPAQTKRLPYDFNRIADAVRELAHEEFPYLHDDLYNIEEDHDDLIEPTPEEIADWQRLLAGRTHVLMYDKFLPEMLLEPGVTFVRSPKGSGKTERLEHISRQCRANGLSVLLIGHRQTLLHSMADQLGLTCYLYSEDGKQKNNGPEDRYAICVDSMGKLLKPHRHQYDVVIVDEAEQVFSHITSASTLKEKRRHCYQLLCHYLSQAKSVILCDADLDAISIEAISQVVAEDTPYHFYLNDYRAAQKQYDLYADEKHLVAEMMAAIGEGGRHYVATNSKRKAKTLHAAISAAHPGKNVMLVTAEDTADAATQHFIDNIRTEILDYDVVIASPTLGTGIDITFDNEAQEIDTVFGFFASRVNTHFDIDQQLARVRHPKTVKVWVTPERFNFETDPSAIEAELILCRNLNDMIIGYTRECLPILEQSFLKVYSQVAAMQRASKNALRHNFMQLREQNGWKANLIERSADASKDGSEKMKEAEALIEANRVDAICNAVPITEDEYRTLLDMQKAKPLTDADECSKRRYELASFYRAPVDAELIDLDDNGKFRKCIQLAETYFSPLSSTIDRSRRFDDESALASDAAKLPLKRELLRELLTSAGLADDNNAIKCNVSFQQANLAHFVATYRLNSRRIEELFRLPTRSDLDRNAVQSLTPLLNLIGLSKKQSANYKVGTTTRVREYQVDTDSVELVNSIIQRRAVCVK